MEHRIKLFLEKVNKIPDGCWIWKGANSGRYGGFHCPEYPIPHNKMVPAHKVSMWLFNGISTDSTQHVMHSCDNGLCVNPEHLSVGTHTDNMRDMVRKNRHRIPTQKMSSQNVKEARQMRSDGMQVKEIALHFKISESHMSRITSGMQPKWKRKAEKR